MINTNLAESNFDQCANLISLLNEFCDKPGFFRFNRISTTLNMVTPDNELVFSTTGPDNYGMMVVFLNGMNAGFILGRESEKSK